MPPGPVRGSAAPVGAGVVGRGWAAPPAPTPAPGPTVGGVVVGTVVGVVVGVVLGVVPLLPLVCVDPAGEAPTGSSSRKPAAMDRAPAASREAPNFCLRLRSIGSSRVVCAT